MLSRRLKPTLVVGVLLFAAAYQLLQVPPPVRYLGFSVIEVEGDQGCRYEIGHSTIYHSLQRFVTWSADGGNGVAECASSWITPQGNYLEFEYAGVDSAADPDSVYLTLENTAGRILKRIDLLPPGAQGRLLWRRDGVRINPADAQPVRLQMVDHAAERGWISLRGKVNHYRFDEQIPTLQRTLKNWGSDYWLKPSLGITLAALLVWIVPAGNKVALWLLYFAVAFVIHFRWYTFFYLDDLEFMERILDYGASSILLTQNEHFLPLFASLHYVVAHIAEDRYLLFSTLTFLVHATNGVLLYQLLRRLAGDHPPGVGAARGLSVLYVLSGLHCEVLQWFTCSAIAWSILTQLWCMIAAWDYLQCRRRQALIQAVGAAALGPLFFGGSFDLAVKLCGLAIVGFWSQRRRDGEQRRVRAYFASCAGLLIPVAMVYSVELFLYLEFQTGKGVSQTPLQEATIPDLWLALRYVLLGSQFGTLYRGTLLASGLLYDDYEGAFMINGLAQLPQDLRMSIAGCALSLGLLAYYCCRASGRWRRLSIFALGQIMLVTPFALSAVVRVRFGIPYAMSPRYYTLSLLGACVLLLPLAIDLAKVIQDAANRGRLRRIAAHCVLLFGTGYLCWHSLSLSVQYNTFQQVGTWHRVFLEQVEDWNRRLNRDPFQTDLPYEAIGTEFAGLHPLYYGADPGTSAPPGLSIVHPDRFVKMLHPRQRF